MTPFSKEMGLEVNNVSDKKGTREEGKSRCQRKKASPVNWAHLVVQALTFFMS